MKCDIFILLPGECAELVPRLMYVQSLILVLEVCLMICSWKILGLGLSSILEIIERVRWKQGFTHRMFGYCRSDPTENDSVEGLRPNARGPGLVTFGVSCGCSMLVTSHSW